MTAIDRAFIRAYSADDPVSLPPSHSALPPAPVRFGAMRPGERAASGAPGLQAKSFGSELGYRVEPVSAESSFGVTAYVCSANENLGWDETPSAGSLLPEPPPPRAAMPAGYAPALSRGPKPLSAHLQLQRERIEEPFAPALEVECFYWPQWFERLPECLNDQLDAVLDQLASAVTEGKLIAVTGLRRGEGRSATAMLLARLAAEAGWSVALVDADFCRPELAPQLGLAASVGWEDVCNGQLPLSEVMVVSQRDRLSLLPLRGQRGDRPASQPESLASSLQVSVSLGVLRQHYQLVIIDAGPLGESRSTALQWLGRASQYQALVVRDPQQTSDDELQEIVQALSVAQVPVVGVVENFVRPATTSAQSSLTA